MYYDGYGLGEFVKVVEGLKRAQNQEGGKNMLIFARHPEHHKEFVFSISAELADRIKPGDKMLVATSKGDKIVIATTHALSGEGANDIAKKNGATFPLKPVLGYVFPVLVQSIREDVAKEILGATTK